MFVNKMFVYFFFLLNGGAWTEAWELLKSNSKIYILWHGVKYGVEMSFKTACQDMAGGQRRGTLHQIWKQVMLVKIPDHFI